MEYDSVCKNYFAILVFFFKNACVAKKRSDGQVLMSFALDEKMIQLMDQNRGALSRSAFIRVAIAKHLGISEDVARPPEREGLSKGGKPTHKKLPQTAEITPPASPVSLAAEDEAKYASKRKKA
jgi:hypothetical protein